jgi:chromosome partition protein MukF
MNDPDDTRDPGRIIAGLARDQVILDLKTVDLCFLAGLHLRAGRASLASFEEDRLVEMFVEICDAVEPGAENPRKRATHAIQRLREQRMLARVDGAGIVRAGEYALTRLAAAVAEYFVADETLTRESLTLLTAALRQQLAEILAAAKRAEDEDAWRAHVSGPLRFTVGDLVAGIERRQRGLDVQQEEVQGEISTLLDADWFGAIDRCQELLDTTAATLGELNEILLRDTHQLLALLQEIQAHAAAASNADAEDSAQRVIEHVDKIGEWGSARQRAWSEYYQRVHGFLRDVVRLDPDRALSQRLRDQVAAWSAQPFHLCVARAPAIRLLRALEARGERPPVARPRADRELPPEWVAPETLLAELEALVAAALDGGSATLSEVAVRVLPSLPEETRYAAMGRIVDEVARRARVASERERAWAPVLERLEIEDWTVERRGAP